MLCTAVPASQLPAPAVVTAYKNLKYAERDFRHIKADDLDLRPIYHRLEERVRAHVLALQRLPDSSWLNSSMLRPDR